MKPKQTRRVSNMKTFGFKTRKEFREKFPDRCADTKEAESFLSESIQQAVAEERERVMEKMISIIKEKSADVILPGLTNTYVSKEILLKLLQEAYATYDVL